MPPRNFVHNNTPYQQPSLMSTTELCDLCVLKPPAAPTTGSPRDPLLHGITLCGEQVNYRIQRTNRKTSIGMVVGAEGLVVRVGPRITMVQIEEALRHHGAKLLALLRAQVGPRPTCWVDGMVLPYLGQPLTVRCSGPMAPLDAPWIQGTLHLPLPPETFGKTLSDAMQRVLQSQALRIFVQRCQHYAPLLGVRYRRLRLSMAKTRWGSASLNGGGAIHLSWRLIHFSPKAIDYVVIHELAHLREMNHSADFWRVVAGMMPDYELARLELKNTVLPTFLS
jgi:predicted metal-dependent hydrolase